MRYTSKFNLFYLIKKKLIPKSLLSRFILIIIIPSLIGQSIALHLFYERHWYNVSYHTSSLLVSEIESLLQQETVYQNKNQIKNYLNLSYILEPNKKINKTTQNNSEELEIFQKNLSKKINYKHEVFLDENGKIKILIEIPKNLLISGMTIRI